DKLGDICKQIGCHIEPLLNFDSSYNHNTVVVSFPCRVDDNVVLAKDMGAIKQLDLVKQLQTFWSDNAVSATVYYKSEELPEIKQWLKQNYKTSIKSISFLLHKNHGFAQSPYESITEEIYNEMIKKLKPLDNIDFKDTNGHAIDGLECSNGVCPVK
ncbi:MAG: hypothetical protein AABY22_15295, partial [Nanoarchaeota archaeon]